MHRMHTCWLLQVFVFGGMTIDGHLLNDLWALDLDNMQWTHCTCYGYTPSPRKGAQPCLLDRAWLQRQNTLLHFLVQVADMQGTLQHADVVLTCSQ